MTHGKATVIKIGGSILRDETSYKGAARLLAEQIEREPTWVVVSATHGLTDALERLGPTNRADEVRSILQRQSQLTGVAIKRPLEAELKRAAVANPSGSRDRLLAWGERASVAALQAHLARRGISVPIVELEARAPPIPRPAALVPGFYVLDASGGYRCLPRGGSDISAMLVAVALGTDSVRFWKEGGGIRTDDGVLPEVDPIPLLGQLSNGVRPLHPVAVRLAIRWGIDMILEDPFRARPATRVTARNAVLQAAASNPEARQSAVLPWPEREWERAVLAGFSGAG